MSISDNIIIINNKIADAAIRSGRKPEDITLVAVSKTVELEKIQKAIDAGIKIIAENKIQEAKIKYDHVKNKTELHFIGHLQKNKVKDAVKMFSMIQSVDSIQLAYELDKECTKQNKTIDILAEIKTSSDINKYGIPADEAEKTITEILKFSNLNLTGLMTIADFTDDEIQIRNCFAILRNIKNKLQITKLKYLSMGMTNDFEIAIEEGSNMVRVGSGIFKG